MKQKNILLEIFWEKWAKKSFFKAILYKNGRKDLFLKRSCIRMNEKNFTAAVGVLTNGK